MSVRAQVSVPSGFSVNGQYILRTEFKNGSEELQNDNQQARIQTGQRLRLGFTYQEENLKVFGSIQDVRLWGNTPQKKLTDAFLSVHEAWAEYSFWPNYSLKVGRQELNYDNYRFLGNLDWAFQAAAHDLALLKMENQSIKVHLGIAYNVDSDGTIATPYTMPQQYKTAQFVRAEYKNESIKTVFMVWNDGRQDVVSPQNKTQFLTTIGLPELSWKNDQLKFLIYSYYQLGYDAKERKVNAFNLCAEGSYTFRKSQTQSVVFTIGSEVLSGSNESIDPTETNTFIPLYGTNHRLNGYMDYFYVGGRTNNGAGLIDSYAHVRLNVNPNIFFIWNNHAFMTSAKRTGIDSFLGVEEDLALGWTINKTISLQTGYSQLLFSDNLAKVQGVSNPSKIQNWAYIMLVIRPNNPNKFIGLKW